MAKSASSLSIIEVRGVVQGVGFRPFIYRLAHECHLKGWVRNTSGAVRIEIEGKKSDILLFIRELNRKAPAAARIEDLSVATGKSVGYKIFEIRPSLPEKGGYQLISPDIATCHDCLREIFDPSNRRYRYPFTNCTNCGPRFTIIYDIPYDRPKTTMKDFHMCPQCLKEYENPLDRRFHAQPNACPECGPHLDLLDQKGKTVPCHDVLKKTSLLLKSGKIVAIKGIGGFLLACDATSKSAVEYLRDRKNRPAKPFAVMIESPVEIKKHCYVSSAEIDLLKSPGSPIVLLKWKKASTIVINVAPSLDNLGIMLPYSPLHHLLMRETGRPLVMTSGNISEEPIAQDNNEALKKLGNIADYFLVHNRDIYARYDDSVMTVANDEPQFVRRARGFAPHPIHLGNKVPAVLACGAEEKNTFCLTRDKYAFISQHIGDMENLETLEHFSNTVELYKKLFRIKPEIIACDMHPEYLPSKYAIEQSLKEKLPLVKVQHHHAHIVSCLAEYHVTRPVIGVALDGTGFGADGHIWGGEFLIANTESFKRAAHLEYLPLPGGAQAIRKPYRIALSYLSSLGIEPNKKLPLNNYVKPGESALIKNQVEKSINAPLTSSMGRLFDAVAALTGVRGEIQYEAQAAIELEVLARRASKETSVYPFSFVQSDGVTILKIRDLLTAIIDDLLSRESKANIAAKFHNTAARMVLETCQSISKESKLKDVALSGGVFQNRIIFTKSITLLESAGFNVYTHHQVPCNDGGVSLGQAVIAANQEVKDD